MQNHNPLDALDLLNQVNATEHLNAPISPDQTALVTRARSMILNLSAGQDVARIRPEILSMLRLVTN